MTRDESELPQPEPTEGASLEASAPAPAPTPAIRARKETSGSAIAATVALVLFSVFIGVFGPRIGNRQQSPSGVTLIEFAEAVVSRTQQGFIDLDMGNAVSRMTEEEFALKLDRITEYGVALPSLAKLRLEATSVQRVRLPGGSGGLAILRRDDGGAVAALAVVLDEDRFLVYDRYGRPIPLPEGEQFAIGDGVGHGAGATQGTVEVYREGGFVIAVYARKHELARELVGALRLAEVERAVRRTANDS